MIAKAPWANTDCLTIWASPSAMDLKRKKRRELVKYNSIAGLIYCYFEIERIFINLPQSRVLLLICDCPTSLTFGVLFMNELVFLLALLAAHMSGISVYMFSLPLTHAHVICV